MNTAIGVKAVVLLLTSLVLLPVRSAVAFPEPKTETITVSVSGDLLVHDSLYEQALKHGVTTYDFTKQLAPIRPLLTADINLCHLETPLTSGEAKTYPVFATPDTLATAIKFAGWDGCSAASNHSLDQGSLGVFHTYQKLTDAGIVVSGIRTKAPKSKRVDQAIGWHQLTPELKVAHLSYSWSTNGIKPKFDWLVNSPIVVKQIISDAKAAKRHGADLVIVAIHAGTEYVTTPNSQQKAIANTITKSAAVDAVIGHHAHVVQDAEILNGKPVVYGLGNFWSGQGPWADQATSQSGALVTLKFDRELDLVGDPVTAFKYAGAKIDTVFTTPEGWQVQPANRIPLASRWGSSARAAMLQIQNRLKQLVPVK